MASPIPRLATCSTLSDGAGGLEEALALLAQIATEPKEVAIFLYFDAAWRVLQLRRICGEQTDAVPILLRDVMADVLASGCISVVMAHNHPSGDPTPSEADYALTRRIWRMLDDVGVRLIDHLILAAGGTSSFRQHGLL